MSIEALQWAWQQPCKSPTAKLVLMALADHANADGECWPSMKRVAELTGVSARQVSTHIADLEKWGYITRGDRRRWKGQLRGWDYRVNLRKSATSGSQLPVTSGSTASSPAEASFRSEPSENRKEEPIASDKQPRKKDVIFEAVIDACGWSLDGLTRSARGQANKAAAELREIDATPDEIAGKAAAYRKQYPSMTLSPTALVKHWSALEAEARKKERPSVWDTYERQEWYG